MAVSLRADISHVLFILSCYCYCLCASYSHPPEIAEERDRYDKLLQLILH